MASGIYRAAVLLAATILISWEAAAETNTHIPPAPDPTLTRSIASREYDGYEIRVAPVVKVTVKIPQLLKAACRTSKDIWACTIFASEKLECQCARRNDRWKMDALVEFVPVMYLRSPRFEEHELEHVEHVTRLLSDHLRELAGREFSTAEACSAVATREMSGFLDLMNGFRRASNHELR